MTLADKSWNDIVELPLIILRWKRYGSRFLFLAILLNALALTIAPLQQLFLSSKTVKTPTNPTVVYGLLDLPDQWAVRRKKPSTAGNSTDLIRLTQNILRAANYQDPQPQMWHSDNDFCGLTGFLRRGGCDHSATLETMTSMADPFVAELPNDFNTGLIRQFIPRVSSTAWYFNSSREEYNECSHAPGSTIWRRSEPSQEGYVDRSGLNGWDLHTCGLRDLLRSPWKPTRDLQRFREKLYFNLTLPHKSRAFYVATLETTAGYFELPNIMNHGLVGKLEPYDPEKLCTRDCFPQNNYYGDRGYAFCCPTLTQDSY
jgi:hypothetical protein